MSEVASETALHLSDIVKTFYQGGAHLEVLRGASLSLSPGEIVALVGPSGAGKTTLLHIAGLLERPSSGAIILNGELCDDLSDDRRTEVRRSIVGFVARALANSPRLLIADEPTGNLDQYTADHVFSMLLETVRQTGVAALIATHNNDLADKMDRVLALKDGVVEQ